MMFIQINKHHLNKHHCMARKGRLKGFQTACGLFCNLKPMRAQCIRMITLLLGGMYIYATVECYLNKTSSTWHAEAV